MTWKTSALGATTAFAVAMGAYAQEPARPAMQAGPAEGQTEPGAGERQAAPARLRPGDGRILVGPPRPTPQIVLPDQPGRMGDPQALAARAEALAARPRPLKLISEEKPDLGRVVTHRSVVLEFSRDGVKAIAGYAAEGPPPPPGFATGEYAFLVRGPNGVVGGGSFADPLVAYGMFETGKEGEPHRGHSTSETATARISVPIPAEGGDLVVFRLPPGTPADTELDGPTLARLAEKGEVVGRFSGAELLRLAPPRDPTIAPQLKRVEPDLPPTPPRQTTRPPVTRAPVTTGPVTRAPGAAVVPVAPKPPVRN